MVRIEEMPESNFNFKLRAASVAHLFCQNIYIQKVWLGIEGHPHTPSFIITTMSLLFTSTATCNVGIMQQRVIHSKIVACTKKGKE